MKVKNQYAIAALVLFLAVAIGAFGAHALKEQLTEGYLNTFKTGSQYHFYHGLGLMMLAMINDRYDNQFKNVNYFFLVGIFLFSFNCYIYSITHIKTFALIVPIGGVSFLAGWLVLACKFSKIQKDK